MAVEVRTVGPFAEVELQGSGTVTIQRGEREALTIEADEAVLPYLTSEVVGRRLVLAMRRNSPVRPKRDPVYALTVVALDTLILSGSGQISYEAVDAERLRVTLSGSGAIRLAGQSHRQEVTLSGSGSYHAADLTSRDAHITISGSGAVDVSVTDTLDVTISGSGSVTYRGDPALTQRISGSGHLQRQRL